MKMYKSLLSLAVGLLCTAASAFGQANHVTISQVYGAGGNTGALYNADYVELFNPTGTTVNIGGWALQYASTAGAFNGSTNKIDIPSGKSIAPNSYFLIKCSTVGTIGSALPTPDVDGTTISAAGGAGKFILINNNTYITNGATGSCPNASNVVDFVAYGGTPTCFEGAGATVGALSATLAAYRLSGGCIDTDSNAADFSNASPNPRNSSSATNICSSGTPPTGTGSSLPTVLCPGSSVTFTVTAAGGTNPAGTVTNVTGDFQAIGLSGTEVFTAGGGGTWTYSIAAFPNVAAGSYNFTVTITDSQSRTGTATVSLSVTSCNPTLSTRSFIPSGVCNGKATTLSVVAIPGQNPSSVVPMTVTADLTSLGGGATDALTYSGSGNIYTRSVVVGPATTEGSHTIQVTVTDDQSRTATGSVTVITEPNCVSTTTPVVISQVFGGGNNSGSTYLDDFVELFNRSCDPVVIDGWSIQYGPSDLSTQGGFGGGQFHNLPVPLAGTIQPGHYYLIRLSRGSTGAATLDLPTPDLYPGAAAANLIEVGATNGTIALVSDTVSVGTTCTGATILDKVGYGSATCFDGNATVGAAAALDATLATFRNNGGCQDTNFNRIDFDRATPNPRNSASPAHFCCGKCCAGDGTCTVITDGDPCTGTYTLGGTCSPNTCPGGSQVGICCQTDGSCTIATPGNPATCATGNLVVNGTCTPNTCPPPANGVCCRGSTCSTAFADAAACAAAMDTTSPATILSKYVATSTVCNTPVTTPGTLGNTISPCCYANYNHNSQLEVQDIFDFLNDWFGGKKAAIVGGDGTTGTLAVQNIFDFLNSWFAGGCN